jgi:hypothetical protein
MERVPVAYHRITRLVLDRMCEHKLYLWLEKCEFEQTRIEYLGIIISHNKVEMDLVKIAGVADWLMPSNKRRCNPSLALSISTNDSSWGSLTMHAHFDMTMKDVRFIWGLP